MGLSIEQQVRAKGYAKLQEQVRKLLRPVNEFVYSVSSSEIYRLISTLEEKLIAARKDDFEQKEVNNFVKQVTTKND